MILASLRALAAVLLAAGALHAQQGATVEGKVVSAANGQPVRRAALLLRPAVNPQSGATVARSTYMTLTDGEGHFLISGIAPGSYACVPSRQGYGAQPPDVLGPSYYQVLNLKDGDHLTDVVVRLTPNGVIAGRVLDSDGDPISGAQIEVLQYGYVNAARALQVRRVSRSDDRGEFRVFDLFPGQYYIRAQKEALRQFSVGAEVRGIRPPLSFAQTYYPNTADSAKAAPLDLPASGEIRGIDIRLSHIGVYSIRGKVPNLNPENLRAGLNVSIQKRPRDGSFFQQTGWQISKDGYTLPNVAPGSYVITATLQDPSAPAKPPMMARQFVQVVDQDVLNADLTFTPGMEVSGSVRATGAIPLALTSIRVLLLPVEEGVLPQRSNQGGGVGVAIKADGTFTLGNLFPDLYQIRITPPNAAYTVSMKVRDQELPNQNLDLRRGDAWPISIVVSAEMGKIEGIVKDAQGALAVQANVTLIPDETKPDWPDHYNNNVTDSQGRFFFNKVAPGNYQLFAWQDNPRGAPASREFRKPFERYALSVKVEPNGHPTVELNLITNQQQTQASRQ